MMHDLHVSIHIMASVHHMVNDGEQHCLPALLKALLVNTDDCLAVQKPGPSGSAI